MCGVGNGSLPPSLKAYKRSGPRLDSGVAMVRAGANRREPEPQPTEVITYCSPLAVKGAGVETMADFVLAGQRFFPGSAACAPNSAGALARKNRIAAAETNPPLA